jgi:hypothetical protein
MLIHANLKGAEIGEEYRNVLLNTALVMMVIPGKDRCTVTTIDGIYTTTEQFDSLAPRVFKAQKQVPTAIEELQAEVMELRKAVTMLAAGKTRKRQE